MLSIIQLLVFKGKEEGVSRFKEEAEENNINNINNIKMNYEDLNNY